MGGVGTDLILTPQHLGSRLRPKKAPNTGPVTRDQVLASPETPWGRDLKWRCHQRSPGVGTSSGGVTRDLPGSGPQVLVSPETPPALPTGPKQPHLTLKRTTPGDPKGSPKKNTGWDRPGSHHNPRDGRAQKLLCPGDPLDGKEVWGFGL